MKDSDLTHAIIGVAIDIHRALGPGLLGAVYEECTAREFVLRGIPLERQKPVPRVYQDLPLECGYRLDFLVDRRVVLELKFIEAIAPIQDSVVLTYLRLSGTHIGLLIKRAGLERWRSTMCGSITLRRRVTPRSTEETRSERKPDPNL